jgi:lipoyl(octanoyl) transferase
MKQQNREVKLIELGVKSYKTAWDFQEELFQKVISQKRANRENNNPRPTSNYLLWVEHPPVYTLGKSGDMSHLLLSKKQLQQKGITFFKTNRGGDITFHGPGQIVGYPIFDLDNFFTDIHKYLRLLEQVVIDTIAYYNIKGERISGETGVWLDVNTPFVRKICAMGVRASRWVTMHGFALNVNTPISYFDHIIPCGIAGKGVTSMEKELKSKVSIEEVKERLLLNFEMHFKTQWIN